MPSARSAVVLSGLFVVALLGQGCSGTDPKSDPPPNKEEHTKADKKDGKKEIKLGENTFTPRNPNEPQELGEPHVRLDAADWYAECKKDRDAIRKYRNKVIELTGTVASIRDSFGRVTVCLLAAPDGSVEVQCFTTDLRPWLKVAPGSKIKVRGKIPDISLVGDLGSVVIVEAGPSPATSVTAAQVARDFLADRKAAVAKYNQKWVHLEGEITQAKADRVTLRGEQDVTVVCLFNIGGEYDGIKALKQGTRAKLFGQLGLADREGEKTIGLHHALLTEPR
jgi:hypothetical protein